jgi:far upstream element-binding protein
MSGMSGMTGMSGMSGMMGGEEVAELMIPANKVGLIIGKGGEMIKALQEKAGCKMQMIQDGPYSNAPEKPLRMSGAPDNCKKARELVLQLMEQKELEFGSQARGLLGSETSMAGSVVGVPHTIEIQVLKQMVGYVIGRGGEHINNIQSNCGVRLQFQNDVPGTDYRIATISGTPEGCQRARKWVDDLVAEVSEVPVLGHPVCMCSSCGFGYSVESSVRTRVSAHDWSCPTRRGPGSRPFSLECPATSVDLSLGRVS